MFNFIKAFGKSINGVGDSSVLRLEDMNVRKCINLEVKTDEGRGKSLLTICD
jgi:hypothetical protein